MKTQYKLLVSIIIFISSILTLRVSGWFGIGAVVTFPLVILWWIDLGRELRSQENSSKWRCAVGCIMGVPQALLGIVCVVCGAGIICWVLYNSFWDSQPSYTGGFLTFGIGPTLFLFGIGFVVDAFRKNSSK